MLYANSGIVVLLKNTLEILLHPFRAKDWRNEVIHKSGKLPHIFALDWKVGR